MFVVLLLLVNAVAIHARLNIFNWLQPSKIVESIKPVDETSCESKATTNTAPYKVYEATPTDEFAVYYHSKRIDVPVTSVRSLHELIKAAQKAFKTERIGKLVSYIGAPFHALEDIPADRRVVALNADELFMFPALKIGEVVDVQTSDRKVSVHTLSTQPKIFEWHNFMSDDECEHIIKTASERTLVKSTVGAEIAHAQESTQRTSSQLWIGPGQRNDDPVFERIRARAAEILRLDTNLAEDTQVVYYEEAQHYWGHHDYSEPYDSNPYYKAGGNRFVTVLYYITDVASGGHTCFPFANSTLHPVARNMARGSDDDFCKHGPGLRVKPMRGRAVMFYNLEEDKQQDGVGDPMTFHIGCNPTDGSDKWLANQWFRNKRVNVNGKMHLYDENW